MIHAQRSKHDMFKQFVTDASNATHAAAVDTLGYNYARITVYTDPTVATNTSAKWTSLQLGHSTTTDATNATAITGPFIGTTNGTATTSQFVLPQHNDTVNESSIRFYVDCRTLERYLIVEAQATQLSTVTSNSSWFEAELWRGEGMPDNDADRGVDKSTFG